MADDDGEEWGVNAELQPEPGTFLAEWHSGKGAPPRAARPRAAARSPPPRADWKDDTKKKRVSVFVNLEGVTVTRVQTKKKDPKVGSWDWYHIKSWDVAPKHFAFKIVGSSKDASAKNYMFDTAEAKAIASKFKEQVNAIMARKRKQKEAAESGQSCEPQRPAPAAPRLARTARSCRGLPRPGSPLARARRQRWTAPRTGVRAHRPEAPLLAAPARAEPLSPPHAAGPLLSPRRRRFQGRW